MRDLEKENGRRRENQIWRGGKGESEIEREKGRERSREESGREAEKRERK